MPAAGMGDQRELRRLRRLPSWLFSKLALQGARLTAETLGDLGQRSDFAVLSGLEAFGPVSQAELGRRLDMDSSDIVAVLNRLQSDEHVRREPDPQDGRRNTIHLTPGGRRRLEDLARDFDRVQAALVEPLTDEERDQLIRLLHRLLDHGEGVARSSRRAGATERTG